MTDGELATEMRGVTDADEAREIRMDAEDMQPAMPRGLVLAVARNMHAMEAYAKMNAGERASFLEKARHTPDGEPMQRLLRDIQRQYK